VESDELKKGHPLSGRQLPDLRVCIPAAQIVYPKHLPETGRRVLLSQIVHLTFQAAVSADEASNIQAVNQPGGDVGGVQEFDGIH